MSSWTLYACDRVGNRLAQIDPYHRFQLIGRHNGVGTWELELPTNTPAAKALIETGQPRISLRVDNITFDSGPVTRLERTQTADGDELVVHGVDDMAWLARRVAHPTPGAAAPPYSTAYDTRTGDVAQIIAQYIDANAGPSAVTARRVPGLVVPVPAPVGTSDTLTARYQNLLDFVTATADSYGLGVRVVDLTVAVVQPPLRAAVFSVDLGTLSETSAVAEAPEANYVYVGGQGEGAARTIVETSDSASLSVWGRAETFQDRRDTNVTAQLTQAGRETLASTVTPPSVSFVPLATDVQQFPRDWTLGDRVTIRVGTTTRVDVVREVVVSLEQGEPVEVTARVGTFSDLAMFRTVLRANRRIRQLERV